MTTARNALPPCRLKQIGLPHLALVLAASLLIWSGCSGGSKDDDAEPAADAAAPGGEAALPEGGLPGGAAAGAMSPEMAAAMPTPEAKEPPKAGAAPFDTTFLDVDTELFVFARLADILNSSLVQTLTDGKLGPLDDVKREMGIDPREIASVTIGVRHLAQLVPSSGVPMGGMGGGMMPGAAGGMPGMGGPMPGMAGPMPGVNAGVPAGAGLASAGPSSTPGMVPGQMPAVGGVPGDAAALPDTGVPAPSAAGPNSTPGMVPGQMPAVGGVPGSAGPLPEVGMPAQPGAGPGGPRFGGAMPASPDAGMMAMQGPAGASASGMPTRDVVAVIRTSDPIDTEALERGPVRKIPYGDKSYYELRQPSGETVNLYLHDAQTLVMADEAAIKQIMDEGDQRPRPTADLGFVKTAPHLLVAVVPKDKAALFRGRPMMPGMGMGAMSANPGMQPMPGAAGAGFGALPQDEAGGGRRPRHGEDDEDSAADPGAVPVAGAGAVRADATLFQQRADAYVLLVDLTSGIGLDVEVKCDTPEAARTMQQVVATSLEELRAQYEAAKPTLPGLIQKIAQPVVDGLSVQTSDSVVSVSTSLPEEHQGSLAVLPAIVMGMVMSGGVGLSGDFGLGGGGLALEASRELMIQEVVDDGQPAANTDELPAGVEVKGLARWGESKYGDQAPAPLELDVAALGGPAAQAVGYGKVTLTEAKTADGTDLKWEGAASDQRGESPINGYVPIDRGGVFSEHPDDGVMVGVLLTPPATPATTLASAAGQFIMQVPASTEDVLVQNVANLRDGVVTNEKLDKASMIVSLDGQERLVVTYNDSPLVGTIEPVTADGVPVETTVSSRSHGGGSKSLIFMFPAPPPNDLALRVTTHADVQEVVVPFRFEGLPLPQPQPMTEEQKSLLVWTRADSPPEYPDLVIEAQGRWKTLEPVAGLSDDAAPMGQNGFGVGMPPGLGFGAGTAADQFSGAGGMPDPAGGLGAGGLGVGVPNPGQGRRGRGRKGDDGEEHQHPLPGSQADQPSPGQLSFDGLSDGGLPGGGYPGGGGATATGSDQPLQIVIDLIGPLAESAEAVGKLHFSAAKTDIDTELAFEGGELPAATGDPVEEFVPLESGAGGQSDGPPHGLRLIVKLTPPNQPIGSLALLSGTVSLRTVRERTEAVIPNLQSRVGKPDPTTQTAAKPVSDRELLKFRLKPVVAIEPNRIMMRLLEGREEYIAGVSLIDHNGIPLKNVQATTMDGTGPAQGHTVYMFDFAGPIPQKIGMKVSVNMGVKDIEIPIRIHNLPLPPLPTDEG